MANVEVNQKAPNFNMENHKGEVFSLASFEGKSNVLVVLNRGFV